MISLRYHLFSVAVCLFLFSQMLFAQQHWPRFHGNNGTGVSLKSHLPQTWADEQYAWQVNLPGVGSGSPVVWGGKIFLSSSDPDTAKLTVMCLSVEEGQELWKKTFDSTKHHLHAKNTFASSTLAVDEDQVYVAFANEAHTWLLAISHDGQQKWKRDFGAYVSSHGFGSSPLVYQDKVVLVNSQQATQLKKGQQPGKSRVIAVNASDGSDAWQTPLEAKRVCYGVPCIYRGADGVDQLIGANTGNGFYSIDPETGRLNWQTDRSFNKRVVASPVLANGLVLATAGSGGGGNYLVAMKLSADAHVPPTEAYRIQSASYVPSPIVVDDLLFLFTDKGIVSCHDVATGKLLWKKRASKGFNGSPVATAKHIYCVDEEGNIHVVTVGNEPDHQIVAAMGEPSRSTPAIVGNRIYFRSYTRLWALDAQ